MAIPSYPITTFIPGSACIGDSRTTLNANFSALDFNLTSLNTSVSTASLSARFITLAHSPFNDGTNPNLFIGEVGDGSAGSVLGSLSGFNIYYDETNNKLNTSTQQGTVTSNIISYSLNGNVGIGTVNPNQLLTVNGNISASGATFNGNVGIGTTTVPSTLTVAGTSALSIGGSNILNAPTFALNIYNPSSSGGSYDLTLGSDVSGSYVQTFNVKPLYIQPAGNPVNIGSPGRVLSPTGGLTVYGTISATGAASVSALQINNSTTQTTKLSTLTTASKFPIYDASGNLLGYIPICSF
jgi:hypothetical protein